MRGRVRNLWLCGNSPGAGGVEASRAAAHPVAHRVVPACSPTIHTHEIDSYKSTWNIRLERSLLEIKGQSSNGLGLRLVWATDKPKASSRERTDGSLDFGQAVQRAIVELGA